jgi:hypothetical protein
MNIRARENHVRNKNRVIIKNHGPVFLFVFGNGKFEFPKEVLDNSIMKDYPGKDIIGSTAVVEYIFRYRGLLMFILRIDSGKYEGKYVPIGRTGFKKLGPMKLDVSDFRKKGINEKAN